jgi:homocysteine S-methyltransferase
MNFVERLQSSPVILTQGAILTRLKYEFQLPTPNSATFVHLFNPAGREAFNEIYRGYMQIASDHNLPMLVKTPTWRAHGDSLVREGFIAPDDLARVNGEAVAFLRDLRQDMQLEDSIYIAGEIGPMIDGYDASGAPDATDAEDYHLLQAQILANAGVDFLFAPTFPSAEELLGISRAFSRTKLPYIVAPVIDSSGRLPDGSSLRDVVSRIDREVSVPPLHFFISCVHPSHVVEAMTTDAWPDTHRVWGLQGNASSLSRQELDNLDHLAGSVPEDFADNIIELHARGIKVLGGCCGTGEAHIKAIACGLVARAL